MATTLGAALNLFPTTYRVNRPDKSMAWIQFKWLLVISVGGIILSAKFCSGPKYLFSIGMTPLLFYHFTLKRKAKDGLSQATIDSVYYFGFLVTIATLVAAIFSFVLKWCVEPTQVTTDQIAFQFGLGLLATGYALFARLHLIGISHRSEEVDPILLAEQYAEKVRDVTNRIALSAVGFETFSNTIMNKNRQIVETSAVTLQQISSEAAKALSSELTTTLGDARKSIDQFSQAIHAASLVTDLENLRQQMRSLSSSMTNAGTRLKSLEQSLGLVDGRFNDLSRNSENLLRVLEGLVAKLAGIPPMEQGFIQLRDALEDLCAKVVSVEQQLSVVTNGIAESSESMANSYGVTSESIKHSASDAGKAIESLTGHLIKMVEFIIEQTQKKGSSH